MADVSGDAGGSHHDSTSHQPSPDQTSATSIQPTESDTPNQHCEINDNIEKLINNDFEEEFRRRTLTVRLRGGLEEKQDKVAIAVNKVFIFEFVERGPSLLRLTFHSREAADAAANKSIIVDGIRLKLSPPSVFDTKLIHLFGIPIALDMTIVAEFLKSNGFVPINEGDFIMLVDKETGEKTSIKTGGRSFVVQFRKGVVIPPSLFWWSNKFTHRASIRIRLWFPGQGDYCLRCNDYGHRSNGCPAYQTAFPTPGEFGPAPPPGLSDNGGEKWSDVAAKKIQSGATARTSVGFGTSRGRPQTRFHSDFYKEKSYLDLCKMAKELIDVNAVVAELKSAIDETLLPEEGKDIVNLTNMKSVFELRNKVGARPGGDNIPFWSRHATNGYMSNFIGPAGPLRIWGEDFKSPQVFIGYWRNRLLGQQADADYCLKLFSVPHKVKHNSNAAQQKVSIAAWALLTGELLALANLQKYRCDISLRKQLVATDGALVETNTGSHIFASGVNDDDPALNDSSQWPRMNLAGSILEYVREEIRKEGELFEEATPERSRLGLTNGPPNPRSRTNSLAGLSDTGSGGTSRTNSPNGPPSARPPGGSRKNSLAGSHTGSGGRPRSDSFNNKKRERDNQTGGDDSLSTTGKKKAK